MPLGDGPRTIDNPIVAPWTSLGIVAFDGLTLVGPINLNFGGATINVIGTLNITGRVHNGTLVLSGGSVTLAGDNAQRATTAFGTRLTIASDRGLGGPQAVTRVFGQSITLEGGVSVVPHYLELGAGETGPGVGLRSAGGHNHWLGPVGVRDGAAAVIDVADGTLSIGRHLQAFNSTLETRGAGVLSLRKLETYGPFTVASGRTLIRADGTSAGASRVASLAIGAEAGAGTLALAGRFDLNDNLLVIDYETSSPIATVTAYVAAAYNDPVGAWAGNGLTSSMADVTTLGLSIVPSTTRFMSFPANYFGQLVDSTDLLVRLARYGDTNLDAIVDLTDFNALAANFGSNSAFWHQGDFNYDGRVNLHDFNRLAANFGLAGTGGASVDPADWAALATAVPEPAGALWWCAAAPLLARRRRRVG